MNKSLDSKKTGGVLLFISNVFDLKAKLQKKYVSGTLGLRAGSFYMSCMNLMALRFCTSADFTQIEKQVLHLLVLKNHLRDGMGCCFNQDQDKNKIQVKPYESCGFKIENEICFKRR